MNVPEYWSKITTDPLNPDTDADGLPDGLEVGVTSSIDPGDDFVGTDVTKTFEFEDWDGVVRNINCYIKDADGGNIKTLTNPTSPDTNSDGVIDGWQDKNKNGAYNPVGADNIAGTIDDESDAVLGFYGVKEKGNPMGIFNRFLCIAKPSPEQMLELPDYRTLILNRGSLSDCEINIISNKTYAISISPNNISFTGDLQYKEIKFVTTGISDDFVINVFKGEGQKNKYRKSSTGESVMSFSGNTPKAIGLPLTNIIYITTRKMKGKPPLVSPRFSISELKGNVKVDIDGSELWYCDGVIHKLLGHPRDIGFYYEPNIYSIWYPQTGIYFITNKDKDKSKKGILPRIHEIKNYIPKLAKYGFFKDYEDFNILSTYLDSNAKQELTEKSNSNGITFTFFPAFGHEYNGQFVFTESASTIKNNLYIGDFWQIFIQNAIFNYFRWANLEKWDIYPPPNSGDFAFKDELIATIVPQIFLNNPDKEKDFTDRYDIIYSACVVSHELGHYLDLDDLSEEDLPKKENTNRLMNNSNKNYRDEVVFDSGTIKKLILNSDEIKKSQDSARQRYINIFNDEP